MPTTHHHAILCGVSLHIVRFEVAVRKVGVGTLGVGDAVGVILSEDSLREVFAGLSLDFAALDRELLAALVAIGSHFALGECRVEDNLLDNLGGLGEELRQCAKGYIGVISINVYVEV